MELVIRIEVPPVLFGIAASLSRIAAAIEKSSERASAGPSTGEGSIVAGPNAVDAQRPEEGTPPSAPPAALVRDRGGDAASGASGAPARGGCVALPEKACAERDVPPGAPWAFRDHRTMADVLRDELPALASSAPEVTAIPGGQSPENLPAPLTVVPALSADEERERLALLGIAARRVYSMVRDVKDGWRPSVSEVRAATGFGAGTVQHAFEQLHRAKLLTRCESGIIVAATGARLINLPSGPNGRLHSAVVAPAEMIVSSRAAQKPGEMTPNQAALYEMLLAVTDGQRPMKREVAEKIGCSVDGTHSVFEGLERRGLIRIEPGAVVIVATGARLTTRGIGKHRSPRKPEPAPVAETDVAPKRSATATAGDAESVEAFLARGGQITRITPPKFSPGPTPVRSTGRHL